jgi:hypothetical protein
MAAEYFLHYFKNAYGMMFAGAKETKSPEDDALSGWCFASPCIDTCPSPLVVKLEEYNTNF